MTTTTSNPYAPPQAFVRDIVADVSMMPADRGTRLVAAILDGIIFFVMVYAPLMVVAVFAPLMLAPPIESGVGSVSAGAGGAVILVGLLFTLGGLIAWSWLTIRYVVRNGQSIAKNWLGIKVVRADGSPVTLGRLFWLRNVVNGLLGIIPLYGLIDILFIFAESRQCLHDKLADTIVIKA
jgi:uncharacterized RDD family membrane protein YckC